MTDCCRYDLGALQASNWQQLPTQQQSDGQFTGGVGGGGVGGAGGGWSTEDMLRKHREWLHNYQRDISLITNDNNPSSLSPPYPFIYLDRLSSTYIIQLYILHY